MTDNLRRVPHDVRKGYGHQAYDVTFGGLPKEGGPAGYGKLLPGVYKTQFWVAINTDTAGTPTYKFSIPPGV